MERVIELVIIFYLISSLLRFLKKSPQKRPDQPSPPADNRGSYPPIPHQQQREPLRPPSTPPSAPRRESASPSPDARPRPKTAPAPATSSSERKALDVLAEWERRARAHREGATGGGAERPKVHTSEAPTSRGKILTEQYRRKEPTEAPPAKDKIFNSTKERAKKAPPLPVPAPATAAGSKSPSSPSSTTWPESVIETIPQHRASLPDSITLARGERAAMAAREGFGPPISDEVADFLEKPALVERILFLRQPALLWQGVIMSEILRPPLARRNPFLPPYLRG